MLNSIRKNIGMRIFSSRGFSLLEVLITILVISFGLLALATLQTKLQTTQMEAYQRAQALVIMQTMIDKINVNYVSAADYVTGLESPLGTGDDQPSSCADLSVGVNRDKCEWSLLLKGAAEKISDANVGAMIGARGCIDRVQQLNTASGVCVPAIYRVSVTWQGMNKTTAPSIGCGSGAFGDSGLQRLISTQVTIGLLNCV